MGEGELARVLAAVEALTSQVGDISTAVQRLRLASGLLLRGLIAVRAGGDAPGSGCSGGARA